MVERAESCAPGTRRIGRFLVLDPRYLAPILVAWGISLLIFLAENDLGSSFLFFALFIGMLWVATGPAYYLGLGAGLFGSGRLLRPQGIGHAKSRVQAWLDPWAHANTSGYQIIQGWFAIAAGGVFGEGPGQSNAAAASPRRRPTSSSPSSPTSSAWSGHGAADRLSCSWSARGLRIALRCERRFREAAGHRAVAHPRRPDLRDRRRRHPADPPDRHHPALRLLRRVVADRQLHPAGPAAAHFHTTPRRRVSTDVPGHPVTRHEPADPPRRRRASWCCSSACSSSSTTCRSSTPRLSTPTRSTAGTSSRSTTPSGATSSPPTASLLADSKPATDEFKYLRNYPTGHCSARSPASSPSPTAPTEPRRPTTASSPAPRPVQAADQPQGPRKPAGQHQQGPEHHPHPLRQAADGRGQGRSAPSRCGGGPRTRRPAPSWPCTPTRPSTRTCCRPATRQQVQSQLQGARQPPGNPLSPGAYRQRFPRLDVQDHHRRRRLRPQPCPGHQDVP